MKGWQKVERWVIKILRRFNLGGRILKTVVAVILAVFIAQSVNYEEVNLAAIVALFTVQRTFYHSLLQSLGKVGSVLIGALLGTGVAVFLGEHALTFGLITMFVIVVSLKLNLQAQIPIMFVIATFMVSPQADNFQAHIIIKQVSLALIGSGSALATNYFFTPDHKEELKSKVENIDAELRYMLEELAAKIPYPPCDKDSSFFEKTSRLRKEASEGLQLSKLYREEQKFHFWDDTLADVYRAQFRTYEFFIDTIEEIYRLTIRMNTEVPQSVNISKLTRILKRMQKNALYGRKNPYNTVDRLIQNLEEQYENMELPATRDEFKSRASLYHIFKELKRYYKKVKEIPTLKEL